MNTKSCASIKLRRGAFVCGALLSLLGCSRSAVVVVPENNPQPEESASAKPVARAQQDDSEKEKPVTRAPAVETTRKKTQESSPVDKAEAAPFRFPEDAGGRLLAKVLPPKDAEPTRLQQMPPPSRRSPASDTSSPYAKLPSLPLPSSHSAMPRLPQDTRRASLHPTLVLDETLGSLPDTLVLPQAPSLPECRRVRVASLDVNEPIPLPILARPMSDRASLDDPTVDVSSAAAIAAPIPARTKKAPFLKLTLPDPYDRRRTDEPAPEESKEFPLGTPQRP